MRILAVSLMTISLIFGITFSVVSSKNSLKLGPQYRGGFQATVGVYDNNKEALIDNLPNGDAKKAADALEAKLSPFSDGSVDIKISGNSRLTVTVPTDLYSNNQQLFENAIESSGGLFALTDKNKDIMLDPELMTKIGKTIGKDNEEKIALSDVLSDVDATSIKFGASNQPYLSFNLPNDNWEKIVTASSTPEEKSAKNNRDGNQPSIKLISDIYGLMSNFRSYYNLGNTQTENQYVRKWIDLVQTPIINKVKDAKTPSEDKELFKDFFYGQYHIKNSAGNWETHKGSLVDETFIESLKQTNKGGLDLKTVTDLKKFMNPDDSEEHKFEFSNSISKYVYDSNSVAADFAAATQGEKPTPEGKYHKPLEAADGQTKLNLRIDQAFAILVPAIFEKLYQPHRDDNGNLNYVNKDFNKEIFKYNFIHDGTVEKAVPNGNPQRSYISQDGKTYLLQTSNYTLAKAVKAQISANTLGLSFRVFSMTLTDPIISNVMFIASIIILVIIAIAAFIFMLFFYRLLGLFSIIIALTIGALLMFMYVPFGITIGPEFIAIMFMIIGLIFDISVIYFEALKNHIYLEKRPLISSFKIGNHETLGIVVDMIFATLIPNIVLFWIGTGALKNFATIASLGLLLVFVLAIVFFRILIYFLVRTNIFKKHDWLLPIDTSFEFKGSFLIQYLIETKQAKLDTFHNQQKLSSKELIKIKQLDEEIKKLIIKQKEKALIKEEKNNNKEYNLNVKMAKSIVRINKLQTKLGQENKFKVFFANLFNPRKEYLSSVLSVNTNEIDDPIIIANNNLKRLEHNVNKTGIITGIITVIMVGISLLVAIFAGLNYAPSFGKGTDIYVYGTYISDTYKDLSNIRTNFDPNIEQNEGEDVVTYIANIRQSNLERVMEESGLSEDQIKGDLRLKLEVDTVKETYEYIISHNYLHYFFNKAQNIYFDNLTILSGTNYDSKDGTEGMGWISINTTSHLIEKNNILKIALQRMAADKNATSKTPAPATGSYGVLGLDMNPHTVYNQMEQIFITFAIVLGALLIYIMIRFKWTYYIALAIGIIAAFALTIATIVVLRVPVSIEILYAIMGTISFSIVTGIIILGKGKSIIASKNEKDLHKFFNHEVNFLTKIKEGRREANQKIYQAKKISQLKLIELFNLQDLNKKKKKKQKQTKFSVFLQKLKLKNWSKIKFNFKQLFISKKYSEYKQAKIDIKKTFKLTKIEINQNFKASKLKLKEKIKFESRKNNFLKHVFASVIKFSMFRTLTVGILYIFIGLCAAVTLPTITGMGVGLIIGVIVSILTTLTIVLPIWIALEQKRIRTKYAFKKFVKELHVETEEQIIKNIND